jgi:integrase
MNDSLGSFGDFPIDGDKQDIAAQAGSHNPGSDKHLFTRKQIRERLMSNPLPRPIPPEVLVQLDKLLDQAIQSMVEGIEPAILSPMMWDALLLLYRTGIRCSELTLLEAPSQADHQGCLEQDSSGSWWLLVKAKDTKLNKDYRIPIQTDSGMIEAVHRQCLRISDFPDILGKRYLFRDDKGLLSSTAIGIALRKLAVHLIYEDQPYKITTHQFRHTLALDMLELSELMGHTSLSPVYLYYAHSRPESLLKELDRLREKLQRDEEQSEQESEQKDEEQEGQEE